jgi:hypothetical protein
LGVPTTTTLPKDGDRVLLCGHRNAPHYRIWTFADNIPFGRPDGTVGEARFLIACLECFTRADGQWQGVTVQADEIWHGQATPPPPVN